MTGLEYIPTACANIGAFSDYAPQHSGLLDKKMRPPYVKSLIVSIESDDGAFNVCVACFHMLVLLAPLRNGNPSMVHASSTGPERVLD
jgi:hypothetical protein